jgi:hypothetical protein
VDLLVAWVLFPVLLLALCAGNGLLLDRFTGRRLSAPLIVLTGFALIVVIGQFLTLADATAEWTTPAIVVLAVAGFALGLGGRGAAPAPWAFAAAVAVFAVYAAPIVLSGEPTIAGFIKLDDTATWLTLTDRIMEHGRDLGGLAPSSFEATLHFNLGEGYPVGVFVPLGVGAELTATDAAWLIQPYIAFAAALLALGLSSLATPLVASQRLRAAVAFAGAQPALLFGYYLWGGIKEVVAAALIAAVAAVAVALLERFREPIAMVALAVTAAALVGVLSAGGLVWVLPALLAVAVLVGRRIGAAATALRALGFVVSVAVLSLPLIVSGALLPPTSSPLTDGSARGNLIAPLDPLQAAGIWPSADFRLIPDHELAVYLLIAVVCAAAVAGLVWSLRRRDPGPAVYVLGALAGCAALVLIGSPWVAGKALATASPAIPFAAMLAIAWLATSGRRLAAGGLALAVVGGIVWSNALGYGGVSLAPQGQLADLERIGERVAGEGPTLMTEYEPYGVRHFLRDAQPEGISELRRRVIPLLDGTTVAKGGSADTDRIDPAALGFYRTLVLRRSPAQSRPPAPYRLIYRGESYEAWQRPPTAALLPERLPLGDRYDPYAVPRCDRVIDLASRGDLVAAAGEPPVVVPLPATIYPQPWAAAGMPDAPVPTGPGTIEALVRVDRAAEYEIWLGGSLRPAAELLVDGHPAGEVRHQLNNFGQYMRLGTATLAPGSHRIELRIGGADLHPGSGGSAGAIGPLVLSSTEAASTRLISVPAADARSLCGQPWDWIEVAR